MIMNLILMITFGSISYFSPAYPHLKISIYMEQLKTQQVGVAAWEHVIPRRHIGRADSVKIFTQDSIVGKSKSLLGK